jgi:hypothetical protein
MTTQTSYACDGCGEQLPRGSVPASRREYPRACPTSKPEADTSATRRKVPLDMTEVLGKREIVIPLGRTPADAMKRYAASPPGVFFCLLACHPHVAVGSV